jgi:hypothetical protein
MTLTLLLANGLSSGYQGGVCTMQAISRKAATRVAQVAPVRTIARISLVFIAGLVATTFFTLGQARAGFCSATNCALALTNSNFIGTGNFGTVTLSLSSNVVTVDVNLGSAYRIVNTGFPGSFGFADNLGGGLTIGNFKTAGIPTTLYSGFKSSPSGCTVNKDCHWDGFGYANNAVATQGARRPDSLQQLSFAVSKGLSITDIRQILQKFTPPAGNGPAYFVVDACVWRPIPGTDPCASTGLFAVTHVPEPASLVIVASALLIIGFLGWRRVI